MYYNLLFVVQQILEINMAMDLSDITLMVMDLKNLISRAFCGEEKEHRDLENYAFWRTQLISNKIQLPEFVKDCTSFQEILDFVERKFNNGSAVTPIDRRGFIKDEFKKLLDSLEFNDSADDLDKE